PCRADQGKNQPRFPQRVLAIEHGQVRNKFVAHPLQGPAPGHIARQAFKQHTQESRTEAESQHGLEKAGRLRRSAQLVPPHQLFHAAFKRATHVADYVQNIVLGGSIWLGSLSRRGWPYGLRGRWLGLRLRHGLSCLLKLGLRLSRLCLWLWLWLRLMLNLRTRIRTISGLKRRSVSAQRRHGRGNR